MQHDRADVQMINLRHVVAREERPLWIIRECVADHLCGDCVIDIPRSCIQQRHCHVGWANIHFVSPLRKRKDECPCFRLTHKGVFTNNVKTPLGVSVSQRIPVILLQHCNIHWIHRTNEYLHILFE